ncbi:MAG: hypothetical protein A4E29_00156 [Methanomassiliicoccales archaeon PtaB.Bin134]|jgi:hypothetical protein|nr:MAG: hypothetical protein A4E29_00156 [Methanomassiliicoccales archaeon PtaB.Bin134]
MELFSLRTVPKDVKIAILREMGYSSDGVYISDKNGALVIDPYIDEPVKLDNMMILHGSEVILDNNPLSVASYFEDYGENL